MGGIIGKFITLEGGEGAGKSTQIRLLADRLRSRGIEVQTTREPGGAPGAEAIRTLLVEGEPGRWTPMTETLLHFAARSDHLARTINPARAQGIWVISDRFADSTRAYQGAGQGINPDVVSRLYDLTVGADGPDLTLILDLPVEIGLERAAGRGGAEDRYERMGVEFHQTLRAGFLAIAQAEPERCVVIDADAPVEVVAERIWTAVNDRLHP
jgi:dTMP kinase